MLRLAVTSALGLFGALATNAQTPIPARPLGRIEAETTVPLAAPADVRQLRTGRVLINDPGAHLVLSFDSLLTHPAVVFDSVAGRANSYGTRPGGLIAYLGDSTLFIDGTAHALVIVDGAGQIARTAALPAGFVVSSDPGRPGGPGVDDRGRLLYWRPELPRIVRPVPGEPPKYPAMSDIARILAYDLRSGRVDTVAVLKSLPIAVARPTSPLPSSTPPSLFPVVDDWAVTPNGNIAIVRGQDYHIDWLHDDGSATPTPKITYEWRRLSDDEKVRIADSATVVRDSVTSDALRRLPSGGIPTYGPFGGVEGYMSYARNNGDRSVSPTIFPVVPSISPLSVPDYISPITQGSVRADADGRIWIRTRPSKPTAGGVIYDIVNAAGALIDRVQLPEQHTLLGFGPGGIVYLLSHDAGVAHVARARFR